jgi:hypothetical protein
MKVPAVAIVATFAGGIVLGLSFPVAPPPHSTPALATQPYVRALRGWRDVTRDAAHEPKQTQFRIDLRSLAHWISGKFPQSLAKPAENSLARGLHFSLRVWDLFALSLVLQIGMLPLMARDFHRVTLAGPIVNLTAVPIVGAIVPLGFMTLAGGLLIPAAGKLLAAPLGLLTLVLMRIVQWFAHLREASYRIPAPPIWLTAIFFIALVLLAFFSSFDYRQSTMAVMGFRWSPARERHSHFDLPVYTGHVPRKAGSNYSRRWPGRFPLGRHAQRENNVD